MVTLADLKRLTPGDRLALGASMYARRNRSDDLSFYVRVDGRDLKGAVLPLPATKAMLDRALSQTLQMKRDAPRKTDTPAQKLITLADCWRGLLTVLDMEGAWSARNRKVNILRVAKHLEPSTLWDRPVATISARDISDLIAPIRRATPDQARKLVGLLAKTFRHAQGAGLITVSPVDGAKGILANTSKARAPRHYPALTEPDQLRTLFRSIREMTGVPGVRNALTIQALTALRSGEVVRGQWDQLTVSDDGTSVWRLPRVQMKVKEPARGDHVLNLCRSVTTMLLSMRRTGSIWMFSGADRDKPVSEGSLDNSFRRQLKMAGKHVPHSWRASMQTLASAAADNDGRPMFNERWIDSVLDHLPQNAIKAAYTRGSDAAGAGRVLAWWADLLMAQDAA
jgi:integrase